MIAAALIGVGVGLLFVGVLWVVMRWDENQ